MITAYPGIAPTVPTHADPKVAGDIARVLRQHGAEHAITSVLAIVNRPPVRAVVPGPALALTQREAAVLAGMARGGSNSEIGKTLYITGDTVKSHARRLFKKLGARDRAHAVALGYQTGLLGGAPCGT